MASGSLHSLLQECGCLHVRPGKKPRPNLLYVGLSPGHEHEASLLLATLLRKGVELSLYNDLDEGGEGMTTFVHTAGAGFKMMTGGHGWSSDWNVISETALHAAILELAPLNGGRHENHNHGWGSLLFPP